jgi:uncharacterized membrane protein YqjE
MDAPPSDTPGLIHAFRGFGAGLLGMVHERLQLLSTELHEEKFRLIQIFIWISAAVFAGMMAITFASLTIVYLFWESARLGALVGMALLYVGGLVTLAICFKRYLSRLPRPFEASIDEIGEDRACIQPPN